ncbi:prepilin-type N-terminal cleavage/methylation domain-containing protein [Paludisphaera mucosa]|uniref:Prepilin-type N-terminal cleavage/methylation domain-containing protein n=1 Tax=Paludisphaera mucosa TaxID=3030827 RepID=A0ABT6F768_9BACT|nr:prepilin-type N-terminal cleavage/methylation domain-containing protein [Paludisphaera mucosa]MDG3003326.1 prepilin-type N-terminal cleavage/methylation domain-containing protein [Paludisphaera mucosa]
MRFLSDRTSSTEGGPVRIRAGFTLIELLVVLVIVLIVSAAALPVVLPALNHRQVNESARLLQGAFVGAQDAAVHANAPRGVRLLPDPAIPTGSSILAANRMVAIEPAPDYSEGRLTARELDFNRDANVPYPGDPPAGGFVYPWDAMGNLTAPVLIVTEQPLQLTTLARNAPTSWFWNIRIGDKLRIGSSGWQYTVVGPMTIGPSAGNPELFVNVGVPGTTSPMDYGDGQGPREFLFLVNGVDDDGDGFTDEGWDGIDNDLDGTVGNPLVDTLAEWERERWVGSEAQIYQLSGGPLIDKAYTITRRPIPSANARETALPSGVVIDLTTWNQASPERTRAPVDRFTGYVDVMFSPQGDVVPSTVYSTPASFSMKDTFFHFWLAERQDLYEAGASVADPDLAKFAPFLPVPEGLNPNATNFLKGEYRIVTLFTRSGQITTNEVADFDLVPGNYNTAAYNPSAPFFKAQQGVRGGQ